jgi:ArsR family transcriptional regulator
LSSDALLKALRAAAEPTRLRILHLVSRTELTVTELTRILDQSQPRVSRHLKLMCDAELLHRTQEGSWAFYRIAEGGTGGRTADALLELLNGEQGSATQDLERLEVIKAEHVEDAYLANEQVEATLLEAVGTDTRNLLDVGTGTGQLLRLLGPRVSHGTGIDASREMLAVARANLESANLTNCQVRQGDLFALPVADASMDCVTIHHVLHFLDEPALAVAEASRTLRSGGRLLIVDFAPHDLERLRAEHAHRRLGFEDPEVRQWCEAAGATQVTVTRFDEAARAGDEPLTVCLWNATL